VDVEDAVGQYAREAGPDVSLRFVAAVEGAFAAISERPGSGSPRYAHELDLPGLRHRSVARFPWLVFYVEREDRIDVWRVLNARSDIPAWMAVLLEGEGPDEGSD
jgi:toxin ParE1/3/4